MLQIEYPTISQNLDRPGQKKYKPLKIIRVINECSLYDEDSYTKEYMAKYGIDNVRGGCYVTIHLDISQRKLIQNQIWMATGKCLRCGRNNHFVKNCYAKTTIDGNLFSDDNDDIEYTTHVNYLSKYELKHISNFRWGV